MCVLWLQFRWLHVFCFTIKSFAAFSGITVSAVNLLVTASKTLALHTYQGENALDQWCATLAIILMMVVVYLTVSVAYQFNRDTIGSLTEKEAAQRQMVDDIIAVADQVRKGTENAMNIVNELNSSTEVVNGAMKIFRIVHRVPPRISRRRRR